MSLQISASDSTGNPLTYSAGGLPPGLQIDSASGLITGTIDGSAAENNDGVYQVTVLADDGQGNNGSAAFTWNVNHTNQAPTLDNPGDQVNQTGDVVSLGLNGYDDDGDTLTYSADGLPPGLSLDTATGLISGTPSAGASTPYSVTVSVSDGSLSASQTFNWFVTANAVTLTNPGDQMNTEGDTVSLPLSATDAGDLTLTYTASGLPSALNLNSDTGLISGTVSSGDAANGPYLVTVSAADTAGNSSAQQFLWIVNTSAQNQNPVVSNPGPQINAQGDVLSLQIQATDPAGNGLTYGAGGLPPGLSIDSETGLISGVLSDSSATGSPYTVTVTATDGSGSGSATFTWSVTNQWVTVTNPGTQTSTGGAAVSLQIDAYDSAQLPLTYAATGLPPGASIDPSTGVISGTLDAAAGGAYQATVMASDSEGNSGSAAFTWNVSYLNQAPTLAPIGDQLNKAGDVVSLGVDGSDVDGDTLTYTADGLPSGLSMDANSGSISGTLSASSGSATPYSVTVTVSDGSLTASQSFKWYVTQNAVTLVNPGDQTNTEGDAVALQLSATDTGDLTLTYVASGLPSGLSINGVTGVISGTVAAGDAAIGFYIVTVSAADTQGNSSAQQFTWYVNAPDHAVTLANPGDQSNVGGDTVSLQLQGNDPDGDPLIYVASGLPLGLTLDPGTGLISGQIDYSAAQMAGGHYTVTVAVNDGNGDTATQTFTWTVSATTQSVWLDDPSDQDNVVGDNVSLTLVGGASDGKAVTYSASGLPAGLTVNPTTGLIDGSITAAVGDYAVTAAAMEGTEEAQETFTWHVSAAANPADTLKLQAVTPAGITREGKNGVFAWPIQWNVTGNSGSGVIIQRIQVSWEVQWQKGDTPSPKTDPLMIKPAGFARLITTDWLEMWTVTRQDNGKNVIQPQSAPDDNTSRALVASGVKLPAMALIGQMNDWFYQTDPGGGRRKPGRGGKPGELWKTYGFLTINGSAAFYEGLKEDRMKKDFAFVTSKRIGTGGGTLLSSNMKVKTNADNTLPFLDKYEMKSAAVSRQLKASWNPTVDDGKTKLEVK